MSANVRDLRVHRRSAGYGEEAASHWGRARWADTRRHADLVWVGGLVSVNVLDRQRDVAEGFEMMLLTMKRMRMRSLVMGLDFLLSSDGSILYTLRLSY